MRCQKHKKYYKEDNTTSVFFPKNDVNVSWLTSVFIKTDVKEATLTLVSEKSMLTKSHYLQLCHDIFIYISFKLEI